MRQANQITEVPRGRPLYTAVRDELSHMIDAGEYPPGSQLPAEEELAKTLGVSRGILREALRELERDSVVTRRQGVGTFVNEPYKVLKSELSVNLGVTEIVESNGLVAGSSSVSVSREAADQRLSEKLRLKVGEGVFRIARVRTADGRPVVYSLDYVPETVACINLSTGPSNVSLYQLLEDEGRPVREGEAHVVPTKAGYDIGRILEINPDTIMLMIEQVDYDAKGDPVMFSQEFHLRQAFMFTVHRMRQEGVSRQARSA